MRTTCINLSDKLVIDQYINIDQYSSVSSKTKSNCAKNSIKDEFTLMFMKCDDNNFYMIRYQLTMLDEQAESHSYCDIQVVSHDVLSSILYHEFT